MAGPNPSCVAASSAASTTSGRITIPAPPPNGVSSTVLCLSMAKLRMSEVSSRHRPFSKALPARLCPSGPGNISGKRVSTRAVQGRWLLTSLFSNRFRGEEVFRQIDDDLLGREIHDGDETIGEGQFEIALRAARDRDDVAGAVIGE